MQTANSQNHAVGRDSSHPSNIISVAELKIPQNKTERDTLRKLVREYAAAHRLVPPLTIEELRTHTERICSSHPIQSQFTDFVTVLVGNEIWWETLSGIPYERRVLLLPQCFRDRKICPATLDEFGILCEQCGECSTGSLQAEAEQLGYVVLVAEGTTVVTKLLEQGHVDAVIGVSCLSVLEKAFPHMAAHAIPGIAIPLLKDGCNKTEADLDWIREAIQVKSSIRWMGRVDIDRWRTIVDVWFTPQNLRTVLAWGKSTTEELALSWLARSGKRWRPLLGACAYAALKGSPEPLSVPVLERVAIAMECFHKASLVHDDIEDGDDYRYGEKTLHCENGIPVALNVGDFLLGEGYRLIGQCGASAEQITSMLSVAAIGHRTLCLGQGDELQWSSKPKPLTSNDILELFRKKTAPAFEVALTLGAILAGDRGELAPTLNQFSESLGIAYQIRDDLEDFSGQQNDIDAHRPSILLALACELAPEKEQEKLRSALSDSLHPASESLKALIKNLRAEEKAQQLFEHYRNEAIRSLCPIQNAQLKSLLRRLVCRILG